MMARGAGKMAVDFQILDNGSAIATAKPVDAAGLPASLLSTAGPGVWTSDNPGVVVTVDPTDPTGLRATVTPSTPPVLVTGAKLTVTSTDTVDATKVISGVSDPIDIVGGPAVGFSVQEQ